MGKNLKGDPNNKVDSNQLQDLTRRRALAALGVSSLALAGPAFVTLADGFLNAAEANETKSGKKGGGKKSGKKGGGKKSGKKGGGKKSGKKGGKKGGKRGGKKHRYKTYNFSGGSSSGPPNIDGGRQIDCSQSDLLPFDKLLCRIFAR